MVECSIREALEETGLHLRNDPEAGNNAAKRMPSVQGQKISHVVHPHVEDRSRSLLS